MKECPACGAQNSDDAPACSGCQASLDKAREGCAESGESGKSHYTVPFSISVSDAHSILFGWLEKQEGENYDREHFHILRMNKKYYECWLFWFLIPQKQEQQVSPQNDGEAEKAKKIIIVRGGDEIPQEVLHLSSYCDFMELCLLDEKIYQSPEYVSTSLTEDTAYLEATKKLRKEEPLLFDDNGALRAGVELSHKVPVALPVWEGAYDYRGGRECPFFINGQKGQVVGGEHPHEGTGFSSRIVTYAIAAAVALIVLIYIIHGLIGGSQNAPNTPTVTRTESITAPPTSITPTEPIPTSTTPALITPTMATPSETPPASESPSETPSGTPLSETSPSPSNTAAGAESDYQQSLKVVLDNYDAIRERDFEKVLTLRTSRIKDAKSSAYYQSMYSNNISIKLLDAKVENIKDGEARINVLITSIDRIEGKKQQANWEGWFLVKKEGTRWLIDDSSLRIVPDSVETLHD